MRIIYYSRTHNIFRKTIRKDVFILRKLFQTVICAVHFSPDTCIFQARFELLRSMRQEKDPELSRTRREAGNLAFQVRK